MGIKIEPSNSNINLPSGYWWEDLLTKEISLTGKTFNNRKKAAWYDELSVLLTSGIQLKQALELLADTQKKEKDQKLVRHMLTQLVEGVSFSEIIKSNTAFSDYEYYALKIGEQTGKLNTITKELSTFYQRKNQQRKEITSSLTYPIIVLKQSRFTSYYTSYYFFFKFYGGLWYISLVFNHFFFCRYKVCF